jgi:hypothetical protein
MLNEEVLEFLQHPVSIISSCCKALANSAWRCQERLDDDGNHLLLHYCHEGTVEILNSPYDDRMDPHTEALGSRLNVR